MKISCTQENLYKGLSIVFSAVGTRANLPVLSNILLSTDKGQLKLSATDLEIGINFWVGGKIEKEGKITVPARLMLDFVSQNSDKIINLEAKGTTLNLVSEHHLATLNGIEASEFPLIPEIKKTPLTQVPASAFKEGAMAVVFAAAVDESRPVLTGVLLRFAKDQVKIVATDSYRLAQGQVALDKKLTESAEVVVPAKTMNQLIRLVSPQDEKISIHLGENQIQFTSGNALLTSRLIEGAFPAYEQIIPTKFETTIEINRSEFASALKMASVFARSSANNVKIKTEKENLTISAVSPQMGSEVSTLSIKSEGAPTQTAFNSKFILDALGCLASEKIVLQFSGKLSPALLKSAKNPNYFYLLMPLQTEE